MGRAKKTRNFCIGILAILCTTNTLLCMANDDLTEIMGLEDIHFDLVEQNPGEPSIRPEDHASLLYNSFIKHRTQKLEKKLTKLQELPQDLCAHTLYTKLARIKKHAQKLHNNYFYVYRQHPDLQEQLRQYIIPTFDSIHRFLRGACPIVQEFLATNGPESERHYLEEPAKRREVGLSSRHEPMPAVPLCHWIDPLINLAHVIYGDLALLYRARKIAEEDFIVCTARQEELTRALELSQAYVPNFD